MNSSLYLRSSASSPFHFPLPLRLVPGLHLLSDLCVCACAFGAFVWLSVPGQPGTTYSDAFSEDCNTFLDIVAKQKKEKRSLKAFRQSKKFCIYWWSFRLWNFCLVGWEFGVWGLGFGVWGWGFGVWGLGSGFGVGWGGEWSGGGRVVGGWESGRGSGVADSADSADSADTGTVTSQRQRECIYFLIFKNQKIAGIYIAFIYQVIANDHIYTNAPLSRPISEVKRVRARLVRTWGTSLESRGVVGTTFFFASFFATVRRLLFFSSGFMVTWGTEDGPGTSILSFDLGFLSFEFWFSFWFLGFLVTWRDTLSVTMNPSVFLDPFPSWKYEPARSRNWEKDHEAFFLYFITNGSSFWLSFAFLASWSREGWHNEPVRVFWRVVLLEVRT